MIKGLLLLAAGGCAGAVGVALALPHHDMDELQNCVVSVNAAYEDVEAGERYFGVCIRELEESSKRETTCERRLGRCQGFK
jgi:hypothetical protein